MSSTEDRTNLGRSVPGTSNVTGVRRLCVEGWGFPWTARVTSS